MIPSLLAGSVANDEIAPDPLTDIKNKAVTEKKLDYSSLDELKPPPRISRKAAVTYGLVAIVLGSFIFPALSLLLVVYLVLLLRHALLNLLPHTKAEPDKKDIVLADFARRNGFSYYFKTFSHHGKPGTLFDHGHTRRISRLMTGVLPQSELPFSMFQYDYLVGGGKSQRAYDLTIIEVVLPRMLPHMVIDSLVEEGNGDLSTLPIEFNKSQRLELEGDFSKYFALYAPDKYSISALTVIAPDAMEVLMRHAALCDIEIIDNKLYFYWPHLPASRPEYEEVFVTAAEVLAKIGKKLSRGNIYAHDSQAHMHAGNTEGIRLQPDLSLAWYLAIPVLVFLVPRIIAEMGGGETSEIIVGVAIISILPIVVITLFIKHQNRRKLRKQFHRSKFAKSK